VEFLTNSFVTKITDKQFRVVIPIDVRELEGIELDDFVKVTIEKVTKK
jgi:bifunctional DNA-binding transcriptional regulator/antitoxin component of YhaV-PrlF toxin-antitoxin module